MENKKIDIKVAGESVTGAVSAERVTVGQEHEAEPPRYDVLDHGYIRLISSMGDDYKIADDARQSVSGEGVKSFRSDEGLIKYLARNNHMGPFEGATFTFEVRAPIFVARQWMRHRTFSYNEMSARYGEVPELFYTPERWRLQSKTNKQASSDEALIQSDHEDAAEAYHALCTGAIAQYRRLLDRGVARELARCVLPVSMYTQFRVTGNLRNFVHFIKLRYDDHAQYEIRVYAREMKWMLEEICPWSMRELFLDEWVDA